MAKKQSLAEITAERDALKLTDHILTVALTDQADDTFRYRDGRDTYTWRAYRLTAPAGGYVVCVFDGFVNEKKHLFYAHLLDTAIESVRHRSSSLMDIGFTQATEQFTRARYNALNPVAVEAVR